MIKKFYILLCITLLTINGYSQMGEWTWMNGADTVNSPGVFGTQGIFDSLNTPPAYYEACEWTDLNGNFWLFGGELSDGFMGSDLWVFNPNINQWAWIKGLGIPNQYGIYGTKGIASSSNYPGARSDGVATWVDFDGNLWLMGGAGYSLNSAGMLNDLWKYNISTNEWTWMAGTDTVYDQGNYGTILIAAPTNNPPPRHETNASWVDNNGNLWYFGGYGGYGGIFTFPVYYSDLWKYDVSINQWTWMKGPDSIAWQPSVYGIKGIPDSANHPSGRLIFAKWKDSEGNFWMFGGRDSLGGRNDLWRFNPTTNEWTWMSGTNVQNNYGTSGAKCIGNAINIPAGRMENRSCWTLPCDNFVNFGGLGPNINYVDMNDLWNYNVANDQWTWMSGSVTTNTSSYGTKTVSSPNNIPPGRCGQLGWSDNSGNLWMFGGQGVGMYESCYNDMWRFVPDTTCPNLCNQTTGIKKNEKQRNGIEVYPNPAKDNLTIFLLTTDKVHLKIEDITGRVLNTFEFDNEAVVETIDITDLDNGLFFVVALDDKNNYIQRTKFVKIK